MNATSMPTAAAVPPAPLPIKKVLLIVGLMVVAFVLGEVLRPSVRLAEVKPALVLDKAIPERFGEWRIDSSVRPVVPDPSLQAALDALYSQTLARTYINASGQRVMLSIAYGSDQSNEATAVHRPEFCYSAQGFRVQGLGAKNLNIAGSEVPVARLVAQVGQRVEPITYWVTLDEAATLPGVGRKLQQIRYGLQGQIPDGMLVRVSSLSPDFDGAFALQQRFLEQMHAAVPGHLRTRFFGSRTAS
jgi:EpsI family protein